MSPSLTRSSTYPVLLRLARSPGSSPRLSSSKSSSSLWQSFGGGAEASSHAHALLSLFSSKVFLALMALLYLLACVALPSFFTAATISQQQLVTSQPGVQLSSSHVNDAATSGQRSVAAMLSNRRMALENPPHLVGGASLRSSSGSSASAAAAVHRLERDGNLAMSGPVMVEYKNPGNSVALSSALDASHWSDELPLYSTEPAPARAAAKAEHDAIVENIMSTGAPPQELPPHCPQGPIRIFVGITSRSATPSAQVKRDTIRRTWLDTLQQSFSGVMDARFILSQPDGGAADAAMLLSEEVSRYRDIAVLPGLEQYRELPAKTLHLLRYALASPCRYTHIVKTDDDVYLRPQGLLKIITDREHAWELDVQATATSSIEFDGRKPVKGEHLTKGPWMDGLYVGKLDSNKTGHFPAWEPLRNATSKWYLSEEDLPDQDCPMGVRWVSGWGYMLSRDLADAVVDAATAYAMAPPQERPNWWGKLPWEDIVVAALIGNLAPISHHPGFKAAWDECDQHTVLKHLDNDAPTLTDGLAAQEASGLWRTKEVVCSSGPHEPGDYEAWRSWRNTLPDNIKGGFM